MKTTDKSTSIKESTLNNPSDSLLQQVFDRYGHDALHPEYLTSQTEEGTELELVPKMRCAMSCEMWFGLCPDFRLFVLKAFYKRL